MATRPLNYIVLLCLLPGCTVQLAPAYDAEIVEQLLANNIETMQFFASVADGTQAAGFPERHPHYARLIGQFDALIIHAGIRPKPSKAVIKKITERFSSRGIAGDLEMTGDQASPSVIAMKKMTETLHKMRATDKRQGVTALEVAAFKGMIIVYMDQALSYEQYLQR